MDRVDRIDTLLAVEDLGTKTVMRSGRRTARPIDVALVGAEPVVSLAPIRAKHSRHQDAQQREADHEPDLDEQQRR
jgi:hypothetical protein